MENLPPLTLEILSIFSSSFQFEKEKEKFENILEISNGCLHFCPLFSPPLMKWTEAREIPAGFSIPPYSGITRTCANHEMEERVLGVRARDPRILASGQRNRFPWNFGRCETLDPV